MKPTPAGRLSAISAPLFNVLHEDPELLVINKPAGLVCHPTKTDEFSSLISRVRLYLAGGAQPQLVNRLDRETSGVTLVAKTDDAARQLRRLWENREVRKEYLAIVHGHVREDDGVVEAPLGKDEHSRVAIKDCVRPDGAKSATRYRVERRFFHCRRRRKESQTDLLTKHDRPPSECLDQRLLTSSPASQDESDAFSLLRVVPFTGRKHQIRIHLAHLGHPIVGDKLYGGDEDLYLALVEDRLTPEQWQRLILPYHALHADAVNFTWRGQAHSYHAEPEPWFTGFLDPVWPAGALI